MGFNMLFYIIFGTNLLTEGPVQIAVFFCRFQCFAEKEYQTESKWNETFARTFLGTNAIQETWSGSQRCNKAATRQEGAPGGIGAPPTLVGPTELHRHTSFAYIYSYTLKATGEHETTFPPPQPFVPVRSHLQAFSSDPSEGDSVTEGFYINTIASPMMCE